MDRIRELRASFISLKAEVESFPAKFGATPFNDVFGRTYFYHYSHVAGNLITTIGRSLDGSCEKIAAGEDISTIGGCLVGVESGIRDLQLYFKLLEQFPQYHTNEFTNTDGHFPGLRLEKREGMGAPDSYVQESARRLNESLHLVNVLSEYLRKRQQAENT